jgi:choline dehydrogenase
VWDVIVVGGGGSGAPLASRLSEDRGRHVLLLEAGPVPSTNGTFPEELLDVGTIQGAMPGHPNNWDFPAQLTPALPYSIARGRILGGSSAINGAYFIRGREEDFARWAAAGNEQWAWDRVLPFYRKLETDLQYGESAVHGSSGPITVSRNPQNQPVASAFMAAAGELGFVAEPDKNDQSLPGYGPLPMNVLDGVRQNTGIAYINPVRHRTNLTVQGDTFVRRVIFEGTRAVGVEISVGSELSVIESDEIVLAAGAIKSPHILALSGIGPSGVLGRLGIGIVKNAPGVGADFSDHPQIAVAWQPRDGVVDYTGPSMTAVLNFASEGGAHGSDLEILPLLKPMEYLLSGRQNDRTPAGHLALLVAVQAATSRGRIVLESGDPAMSPRIDFDYLSSASDRQRMREVVRVAATLLRSRAFEHVFVRLTELTDAILGDDETLDRWILAHLGTALHLCGSARFGPASDPSAVVDQYGRVHGVSGLRVADTSILPTTPTRGPAATAVLIGELVAHFMKTGR